MTPLFTKLQAKPSQPLVIIQAPNSFQAELAAISGQFKITTEWPKDTIEFLLAFANTTAGLEAIAAQLSKLIPDGVLWVAYPKKSSKNFTCEFNRDTGWEPFAKEGFEPVRMVAIDADWSALRFRKVEFIRKMTRSQAISEQGKQRISPKT